MRLFWIGFLVWFTLVDTLPRTFLFFFFLSKIVHLQCLLQRNPAIINTLKNPNGTLRRPTQLID